MSVSRALDQMTRGMASVVGRLEVNAETAAARQRAGAERDARIAAIGIVPSFPTGKTIQDGDYGRLD